MGNISFTQLKLKRKRDEMSRIKWKDFEMIKNVWKEVESDGPYYGFAFCNINHPQYAKYFEEELIPEFVQEAKVKKKFNGICDIVSALFVDFHDKPSQREYLLGYISMVHKDMGLTLQDFDNFMSDLLETLITEIPHLMYEELVLVQMRYFNNLTETLLTLMDEHRRKLQLMGRPNDGIKNCCQWHVDPDFQIIYGFPLKYWLYKKRYWEYRRAIWSSIEIGDYIPSIQHEEFKAARQRHRKLRSLGGTLDSKRIHGMRHSRKASMQQQLNSGGDDTAQAKGTEKGTKRRGSRKNSVLSTKVLRNKKTDNMSNRSKVSSKYSPTKSTDEYDEKIKDRLPADSLILKFRKVRDRDELM